MSENQILTKRWDKTTKITIPLLELQFELGVYKLVLAAERVGTPEHDQAQWQVTRQEKILENHVVEQSDPYVEIGYIPSEMITEVEVMEEVARGHPMHSRERVKAMLEIERMIVRWGVKDHGNCYADNEVVEFTTEIDFYEDKECRVPDRDVLDYYNRRRWMKSIRWAVWQYNTLSDEKKSNSLFTCGEKTLTSVATSVG